MKISFVIPVYYVEQYLEQCIRSVLRAWKKDREVIFVLGDRSDPSIQICEFYQKRVSGIFIVFQNGKGLSNARNCGLKRATGDYILFIDSDDYICSKALEKRLYQLEKFQQKVDVFVSDYYSIYGVNKIVRKSQQIENTEEVWIERRGEWEKKVGSEAFFKASGSVWNVWRYIYRMDFLKSVSLTFLENTANEDVLFTTQVFLKAEWIAYFHLPYYCYRVRRDGALTTQIGEKQIYDFLSVIKKSMKMVMELKENQNANFLKEKLQREYLLNLPLIYEIEKAKRKQIGRAFWNSRWILRDGRRIYYRFLFGWIQVFGMNLLAWFFYRIREIRRKRSGIYKKFP